MQFIVYAQRTSARGGGHRFDAGPNARQKRYEEIAAFAGSRSLGSGSVLRPSSALRQEQPLTAAKAQGTVRSRPSRCAMHGEGRTR